MLTQAKREFIEFMMSADVLRFGNFVTKSGRNTPYFVNTGNYRPSKQLATLGKFYARLIHETLGDQFDAMFGPAYKGIPLAAVALLKLSGLAHLVPDGQTILLVSLLATCTPSASTITQMAQIYGKDADYASAINVVTTLLCIFTMPLMVALYQL